MYTVSVRRKFIAQHFMVGGNFGSENQLHSHHYQVELQLRGTELDKHGFLLDIDQMGGFLDQLAEYYSDQTLNELPEFKDHNPSIERFACILAMAIQKAMSGGGHPPKLKLTVKLWEHEDAWAACTLE